VDLNDFSKLRIEGGRIHYFLYQQDGTKQPMSCPDTTTNRLAVSWFQKFDSPSTGSDPESVERRLNRAA